MRIDFKKYRIKIPKDAKPNNKHYKRMIKKMRRDLPRLGF